jgi:cytidine deaminase
MKTRSISISWQEFENLEEMTLPDRELVHAAIEASEKAYAPYSKFSVGAALRLSDGMILTGTNVENAAFPSGVCAERTVMSYSTSNYPDSKAEALAIAARTPEGLSDEPVSPCGNCRQVIAEEEFRSQTNIRIILYGKSRIMVFEKGEYLLPVQFSRNNLRSVLP